MTGEVAPVEQTTVPLQQAPPPPAPTVPAAPPEGFVEQARFSGAIKKIEELTIAARGHEAQLAEKVSENERLTAQLGTRDVEKTIAVGERDKLLETATTEKIALERELATARANLLKLKVIKDLGHPELIQIMDTIPSMVDEEALRTVIKDFAGFTQAQVTAREKELLSGQVPPASAIVSTDPAPTSDDAWQAKINTLPAGSPERAKAFDDWYAWQHKPK